MAVVVLLVAVSCTGSGSESGPAVGRTPSPLPGDRLEGGVIINPDGEKLAAATLQTIGWRTDFTRRTVPFKEIFSGGPPKDGIPAIDKPKFVTFNEADKFLDPLEPVAAVEVNGEAKAYPLQILVWHEIVNDVINGEPITVTFCPLCNTTIAFFRSFGGQVLDFGTTGNLRFSDLVMYDRQTETWWQQLDGQGIVGTHAGKRLEFYPSSVISYADFKSSFPQGQVLSRDTGFSRSYGRNPYVGYDSNQNPFLFDGPRDDRLPAVERVVAVDLQGEPVAYPFSALQKKRVVNDTVGGEPIVVFFKLGTKSALDASSFKDSDDIGSGVVFNRQVDGQLLTFTAEKDRFRDQETGTLWDITGRAVEGRLAGKQLKPVVHGNHFWFSWAVFKPDTRIYGS
ncbi:MAG TPA: DUF3179 domain-containing protein [Dehalococcoidia bacterium]|nr:DUF3179 domain-containing protein [Dehalococcoidia bacterium]